MDGGSEFVVHVGTTLLIKNWQCAIIDSSFTVRFKVLYQTEDDTIRVTLNVYGSSKDSKGTLSDVFTNKEFSHSDSI